MFCQLKYFVKCRRKYLTNFQVLSYTGNQQTRIGNAKESLTQIFGFKSYTFEFIVREIKHYFRLRRGRQQVRMYCNILSFVLN